MTQEISLDKADQKIVALDVSTYIDDAAQKVVFNITFNNLPDGTRYADNILLDAQAQNLKIVIGNSGYKKAAGQ